MKEQWLENKIALITGGGKGIGKAIALDFAKRGAIVIVNYNKSNEEAQNTIDEIKKYSNQSETYFCDVSNFCDTSKMIDYIISKFGKIDILVNNAGIVRDDFFGHMSEEDFDDVISINLKGAFNTIKHCIPCFIKNKSGKIINISSIVGIRGNAFQANYSASKAGLIGLTKTVAIELSRFNICSNAIAPGYIVSDMTKGIPESIKKELNKYLLIKREGLPEEVATMASFLASSNADYITGQVISVDGGLSV